MVTLIHPCSFHIREWLPEKLPRAGNEDRDTHLLPQGQSAGAPRAPGCSQVPAAPASAGECESTGGGNGLGLQGGEAEPSQGPPSHIRHIRHCLGDRAQPSPAPGSALLTKYRRLRVCHSRLFYELNLPNKSFFHPKIPPAFLLSQVSFPWCCWWCLYLLIILHLSNAWQFLLNALRETGSR